MNHFFKTVIKELTPPVLLAQAKFFARWCRGRSADDSGLSSKARALKDVFERENRETEEGKIVLRSDLTLGIHPDSREPFKHFCYRSPEMAEELDNFITLTGDRKMFLDIGALHGIFSLVFAAKASSARAVAVDASPIAFARLLYNVHKNQLANITPVECAISDTEGTLRMHYEWEHAVAAENNDLQKKYLSVNKQTVDKLSTNLDFHPDVIKIDVEGHEVKVIRGAMRTLEKNKPLVFLELHPLRIRNEGDRIQDLLEVFDNLGYSAFLTSGDRIPYDAVANLKEDSRLVFKTNEK